MKKLILSMFFGTSVFWDFAQLKDEKPFKCDLGISVNQNYSKATALNAILNKYTDKYLPGALVAIYSESEGWWTDATGYADVENKVPMGNCHLQYLQSVSKSYMAVEILQLKEQVKLS